MKHQIHVLILFLIGIEMGVGRMTLRGAEAVQTKAVQIGETVVYELSAEDSEVVDVASADGGSRIYVVAPASPEDGVPRSTLVELMDRAGEAGGGPREVCSVDLGSGEATSVAAHPLRRFAVVAVKDSMKPDVHPGKLLIVEAGRTAATVAVGPGPDSVAVSPDGRFAVVACEAQTPDDDDGEGQLPGDDLPGSIEVLEIEPSQPSPRIAAIITARALYERLGRDPDRAADPRAIEPEFVAIAPDSSYALVTLQEQSAVAVVDLAGLRRLRRERADAPAEEVGRRCLLDVVLLSHGYRDPKGLVRGVHPDGIAISPDGSFAVTANEAHPKARHLQGISFLDLRGGPGRVRVAAHHSIFDLDPTLTLRAPERQVVRRKGKAAPRKPVRLPRLDPEGVAVGRQGGLLLVALAIERQGPSDQAGSVLFLDPAGALEGGWPRKIARRVVGANEGARPETLRFSSDGSFLYVASERDGGTLSVIGLE